MNKIPIRVVSVQESNLMQIRFFPTDICNYQCSYCFAGLENHYRYPRDLDLTINNFRHLFNYYIKHHSKTKFELTISGGGEPTLWPDLEHFCKALKETHDVKIVLVSNGSRTTRWWKENSLYFNDVVLSCHHEFVNLPHYISIADLLFEQGVNVIAFSLMDARHWGKCVDQINAMKQSKYPWFIEAKPIVGNYKAGMDVYSDDQIKYLSDTIKRIPDSNWIIERIKDMNPYESVVLFDDGSAEVSTSHSIIVNKWNSFTNWKCNVPLEALSISPDGSVKTSCGIDIFNSNIYAKDFNDKFKLPIDRVISCPKALCECGTDTHISKNASID